MFGGLMTIADWAPRHVRPYVAATGTMDEFSDLDLVLVCRDEHQPELLRDAPAFAARLWQRDGALDPAHQRGGREPRLPRSD
jgi:hypothetical protein